MPTKNDEKGQRGKCYPYSKQYVTYLFFAEMPSVETWNPGQICSHHFFSGKTADLPCLGRLETPSPASYHQAVALKKQELAAVRLGNALMNDAWFGQTVDPSQTGQTSLKYNRWSRKNKNALAWNQSWKENAVSVLGMIIFAALVLFACERWIGRCPTADQHDPERHDQSLTERLSSSEVVFRLMPIFLGGIGLPLALAHPLPGLLCLTSALVLFLAGKRKGV